PVLLSHLPGADPLAVTPLPCHRARLSRLWLQWAAGSRSILNTFDKLADHVIGLLEALKIGQFSIYMQDFGAPVGFRIVTRHPDKIRSLIIQNANAYLDGLTPARQAFFKKAQDDRSPAHVAFLHSLASREGIIERQYLRDIPGERHDVMNP